MNKMLQSIRLPFIIFAMLISLCGCGNNRIDPDIQAQKDCENIIECLSNNNTESLKNMFCNTIKTQSDFDVKVQEAVDFFDGEVISFDVTAIGSMATIYRGKQTVLRISPYIWDVKTNTDKIYKIRFYSYLVCEDNKEKVGISELSIECSNGKKYVLGDYYEVNHNNE